jgi:hypothetical protein
MVDELTKERLKVSTVGTAGPYIELAESQIPAVRELLERHEVRYWVEENLISINDSPFVGVINLGRNGDAEAVQAILDSVQ